MATNLVPHKTSLQSFRPAPGSSESASRQPAELQCSSRELSIRTQAESSGTVVHKPTELLDLPVEILIQICKSYYQPWKARFIGVDCETPIPGGNLLLVNKIISQIAKPLSEASHGTATMLKIRDCVGNHFIWARSHLHSVAIVSDELVDSIVVPSARFRHLSLINIQDPLSVVLEPPTVNPFASSTDTRTALFQHAVSVMSKSFLHPKGLKAIFIALPDLVINKRVSFDLRNGNKQLHEAVHFNFKYAKNVYEFRRIHHTSNRFTIRKGPRNIFTEQIIPCELSTDGKRISLIPPEWAWTLEVKVSAVQEKLHRAYTDVETGKECERLADEKNGYGGLGKFCSGHCHKADTEENTLQKAMVLEEARWKREPKYERESDDDQPRRRRNRRRRAMEASVSHFEPGEEPY